MKKALLILVIIIGCKTEKEKTNEKIVSVVKKYLSDSAFAHKETIKFYNCDLIKCDTINQNIFDTTVGRAENWQLYHQNNLDDDVQHYLDTTYQNLDSTWTNDARIRKNPSTVYQLKMFIKATETDKNILDTMTVFLNDKLEVGRMFNSREMNDLQTHIND